MKNPCVKECPDRSPTCHAECEKYAEFAAWCEEERENRAKRNALKSAGPGLKRALRIKAAQFRYRGKTR